MVGPLMRRLTLLSTQYKNESENQIILLYSALHSSSCRGQCVLEGNEDSAHANTRKTEAKNVLTRHPKTKQA
jgi:hypothetical protein